jgi:aminopeptidase
VTDPRLARYAALLCDLSLGVREGTRLAIECPPAAAPLATAVARAAWERGAHPVVRLRPPELEERLLREGSDEQLEHLGPIELGWRLTCDAYLLIEAPTNSRSLTTLDPARRTQRHRARRELADRWDERVTAGLVSWAICAYPTPASAQDAQMSTSAYERLVYDAVLLGEPDPVAAWRHLGERQERLIERLARARRLRVRAPGTDLVVDVAGLRWESCWGQDNMPDGEVFCSPAPDAVNGEILFSIPSIDYGRRFEDVRLTFRDGRVVEATAASGEDALRGILDTDEGARHAGEFAIATNAHLQRPVGNTLFDEKIGGTVHLALGRGFAELGGTNVSAIHWDLVCDLRRDGSLEADGEVLLRNGEFLDP